MVDELDVTTGSIDDKLTYIGLIKDDPKFFVRVLDLVVGQTLSDAQQTVLESMIREKIQLRNPRQLALWIQEFLAVPCDSPNDPNRLGLQKLLTDEWELAVVKSFDHHKSLLDVTELPKLLQSTNVEIQRVTWNRLANEVSNHPHEAHRLVWSRDSMIDGLTEALRSDHLDIRDNARSVSVECAPVLFRHNQFHENRGLFCEMLQLIPLCNPQSGNPLGGAAGKWRQAMADFWTEVKDVPSDQCPPRGRIDMIRSVDQKWDAIFPSTYKRAIHRMIHDGFSQMDFAEKDGLMVGLFVYCGHLYSKGKLVKAEIVLSGLTDSMKSLMKSGDNE